ncbi:uncharacterized protein LOC121615601 [Chelmon rostratus]|uniref:uncharacterized protein LOC121615601 n=1 Tax=Chelmon rostratus TaxID=109905 RepID=UPI001BE91F4D|nr:uncharacterized protein LOC121615601 [Chelmon rostratus]
METLTAILFFSTLIVGSTMEDDITASRAEEFSSEGRSVTLSCNYSIQANNLQWYRQHPGSAPQFLLLITDTKEPSVVKATPPNPRLTARLNEERNRVNLQISSAAVSDSALYCSTSMGCDGRGQCISVTKTATHYAFVTLFLLTIRGVSCEDLSPVNNEESSLEDSTVTLSYKYSKQATVGDSFFWYRQYPGKPPEFLISHLGTQRATNSRLTVKASEDQTQMDLQISSAAVTDSALYDCAVRPTVTGNSKTLHKNLCSKHNTILHNVH